MAARREPWRRWVQRKPSLLCLRTQPRTRRRYVDFHKLTLLVDFAHRGQVRKLVPRANVEELHERSRRCILSPPKAVNSSQSSCHSAFSLGSSRPRPTIPRLVARMTGPMLRTPLCTREGREGIIDLSLGLSLSRNVTFTHHISTGRGLSGVAVTVTAGGPGHAAGSVKSSPGATLKPASWSSPFQLPCALPAPWVEARP